MKSIKVTIITICLNSRDLDLTCSSIVNQKFQDFEWIVIDGGSDKEFLNILDKYKSRIDIFVSEKDTGIYNAMNKGILRANGEYLLFLNGGDYFYSEHSLERFISAGLDKDLIYANLFIPNNGKIFTYSDVLDKQFWILSCLPHSATLMKKDLFKKYGLYDEQYKIVSDYDKEIQLVHLHKCSYKHLDFICSCFDITGISSTAEAAEERKKVIYKYFSDADVREVFRKKLPFLQKFFSVNRYIDTNYRGVSILGFLIKLKIKEKK